MQPTLSQQGVQTLTPFQLLQACPSPGMQTLVQLLRQVASTDCTVLITGETGTGKELVARAIHDCGPRAANPFVAQNCGAIPSELAESVLLGHETGAFTGASRRHRGIFEQADRGSVLLDEVGDLEKNLQVKLLRVLDTHCVSRVGGEAETSVDFRLIAATNRDLEAMSQRGTFRSDLFYRLSVFTLEVPPLRKREEDIPHLARYFLMQAAPNRTIELTDEALHALQVYPWPGNIRELHSIMERAIFFSNRSNRIDVDHLSDAKPGAAKPDHILQGDDRSVRDFCTDLIERRVPIADATNELRTALLRTALDLANQRFSVAARLLGMDRTYFYKLAVQAGLLTQKRVRQIPDIEEEPKT